MTWVIVGMKPNYVFMVSDLRVVVDGRALKQFGIIKTQQVALQLIASFAGDVHVGLDQIEFLKRWAARRVADRAEVSAELAVKAIRKQWRQAAPGYSDKERMVGADLAVAGWPTTYRADVRPSLLVISLFWNGAEAESEVVQLDMGDVESIGTGADLAELVEELDHQLADDNIVAVLNSYATFRASRPDLPPTILGLGPSAADGWVLMAAEALQKKIAATPSAAQTVGPLLVSAIVDKLGCRILTLNSPKTLPRLATTSAQVETLLSLIFE